MGRTKKLNGPWRPAGPAWHTLAAVPGITSPRELSRDAFVAELDALTAVYLAAMRSDPAQLPGRRSIMERHATYDGFRALAVTADAAGPGAPGGHGQIVAFSYGFRGAGGQWWHDVVSTALTARSGRALAAAWLADSPARRLYRGLGFADLLTGYGFPGSAVPYAVMGAVLPLRTRSPSPSS